MNQREFAQKFGITREHLNALINGRKRPSPEMALRMEAATGIGRSVWIFGSPEEKKVAWRGFKDAQARHDDR